MNSVYLEGLPQHYKLNLQVLADELEANHISVSFHCRSDEARLRGVRLYDPASPLSGE